MSEVWVRAILITFAFAVVGVVVLATRHRARVSPRKIGTTGLAPGVYLMTSSACLDCETARNRIDSALGEGYAEMSWEGDPEVFETLDIDGVPAVLIVGGDGSGELWSGQPDRALRALGP